MLKFISNTVGSTTDTITDILKLVDINLDEAIQESIDSAMASIGKLPSTHEERMAHLQGITARRSKA